MIQFSKAVKSIIQKLLKGCKYNVKGETITRYITEDLTDSVSDSDSQNESGCENECGTEESINDLTKMTL